MTVHRLVLRDRGDVHVHRWAWRGQYRRRKREAVEQHRFHAHGAQGAERGARVRGYGPRRVTAYADLPDGLR